MLRASNEINGEKMRLTWSDYVFLIAEGLPTIDIRGVTGDPRLVMRYIAKYISKSELIDINDWDAEALLYAIRYRRKIQSWGLRKREKERDKTCPHCGKPNTECKMKVVYPIVFISPRFSWYRRSSIYEWIAVDKYGVKASGRIWFHDGQLTWTFNGEPPPGSSDVTNPNPPPPDFGLVHEAMEVLKPYQDWLD